MNHSPCQVCYEHPPIYVHYQEVYLVEDESDVIFRFETPMCRACTETKFSTAVEMGYMSWITT